MIWLPGVLSQGSGVGIIDEVPVQSNSLTYTGSALSPTWNYFDESKMIIGGTLEATKAGTYHATFTPKDGFCWADGTTDAKSVAWAIQGIWKRYGVTSVSETSTISVGRNKYTSSYVTASTSSFSLYSPSFEETEKLSKNLYVMSISDANTTASTGSSVYKITAKTVAKYRDPGVDFDTQSAGVSGIGVYNDRNLGTSYSFDENTGTYTPTNVKLYEVSELVIGHVYYHTSSTGELWAHKVTSVTATQAHTDCIIVAAEIASYTISATKYTLTGSVTEVVGSATKYSNRKISGNYLNILEGA